MRDLCVDLTVFPKTPTVESAEWGTCSMVWNVLSLLVSWFHASKLCTQHIFQDISVIFGFCCWLVDFDVLQTQRGRRVKGRRMGRTTTSPHMKWWCATLPTTNTWNMARMKMQCMEPDWRQYETSTGGAWLPSWMWNHRCVHFLRFFYYSIFKRTRVTASILIQDQIHTRLQRMLVIMTKHKTCLFFHNK